jgi:[ribosomal protein S5]-alanine N-acetyltransferase
MCQRVGSRGEPVSRGIREQLECGLDYRRRRPQTTIAIPKTGMQNGPMPELEQLRADHALAVLAFEVANRAYFAASISDRGDDFFAEFADRHTAMLAEQEAGICAFYVLVADDGSVLGRFNLYDLENGTANLGYRVAQQAAGRGVATHSVRELCRVAVARHGLRTLRAACSHDNAASQRVLAKAGFVPLGPATPDDLGGKSGTWYERDL